MEETKWYSLMPQWISALATFVAALFTFKAASAAKKSADKQAELVAADIRPVLGLTDAAAGLDEKYYPISLYFTNHGKGAAWILTVKANEKEMPIEAHIGTPVCVGPDARGEIKLFLGEINKVYEIKICLYYWDINGDAHSTTIKGNFGWMQPRVGFYPLWTVNNEEIYHNIPGLMRPSKVQHKPGLPNA